MAPHEGFFAGIMAPAGAWPQIRKYIFRNGNRAVVGYVLVAVLLNHIRRLLAPWLGQFLFYHALSSMKLARSSPHYFLHTSLRYEWWTVIGWLVQAFATLWCRRALAAQIVDEQVAVEWEDEWLRQLPEGTRRSYEAFPIYNVATDVKRVLYLWLVLTDLERRHTEACWAGAHAYAVSKILLRDSPAERVYTLGLLLARWDRVPLIVGLFLRWLHFAALPSATRTVKDARKGYVVPLLVHGMVWYGTAYLVRYSNKYFVLLEMSDMWVTFGWMGMGALYVLAVTVGGG